MRSEARIAFPTRAQTHSHSHSHAGTRTHAHVLLIDVLHSVVNREKEKEEKRAQEEEALRRIRQDNFEIRKKQNNLSPVEAGGAVSAKAVGKEAHMVKDRDQVCFRVFLGMCACVFMLVPVRACACLHSCVHVRACTAWCRIR